MLFLILPYVIQALLIVHVIKTGRNQLWIWVLLFVPVGGGLAYLAVEIIPELFRSRTAQRAARGLKKAMDPGAALRRAEGETRVTGNVASRQRYAEELARHGRYDEAIGQYREALTGLYEHDPNLMLGLAQAQFGKGDAPGARVTLDELIRRNPDFRSPTGHLLYARALEAEGEHRQGAGGIPGARHLISGGRGGRALRAAAAGPGPARRGAESRH